MRSWILGLCFVLAAVPALADDTAKARKLYDEGLRHFNVAEYTQAIDSWKQSYLISKKPLLLFNIGQAYRLSGDCKQAMTFYDNYQDAEPSPKNADELEQAIAACKDKVDKPAQPDAAVTTTPDARPVEATPVDTRPAAPPPPTPTPALSRPVEPAPHAAPGGHRTLGYGVAIGGALLDGAALYFALDGKSKSDAVQKLATWSPSAGDLQSRGQLDNKLAWGFGIAGGAAVVAGVVLIVTGGHSAEAGIAIVPARGGAQIGWAHSF